MPPKERTRRLVSLRNSLSPGTSSYTSICYVLAYYGVDMAPNIARMMEWTYPPQTAPAKVLKQASEQDMKEGFDDGVVWGGVGEILKRHPTNAVIRQLFNIHILFKEKHGSASEMPDYMLADCFLDYPARTLRVALRMENPDHAISLLAWALAWAGGDWSDKERRGDYSKVRTALKDLINSQDQGLRRAALKCHSQFEKELPGIIGRP